MDRSHPPKWPIKRIGIIVWGGIGDGLLFYPALKSLKNHFSDAEIAVFPQRRHAGIFLNRLCNKVYYLRNKEKKIGVLLLLLMYLKQFKPDVIITNAASPEFLSGLLSYFSGAKYRVGYSNSSRGFFLNITEKDFNAHEIDRNLRLISLLGVKKQDKNIDIPVISIPFIKGKVTIGIHPGSGKGMSFKRWSKEKFLRLGKMILNEGYYLVLLGTKEEKDEIEFLKRNLKDNKNFINLTQLDDIRKTAYIVSQLDILISNDTIVAHIGSALDIPVLVIFGPSDDVRYGPFGSKGQIIKSDVPCRPCTPEIAAKCKNRICLEKITPEEVFNRAMEMIEK